MADGIALVRNGRTRGQSGSRTGRILAGMGAGLLTRVLDFGKRFVLVPLFLTAWGGAKYGEWLTLSAAAASLSLLDVGMHDFVVNRLRQCYVKADMEGFRRFLHGGLRLSLIACGAGLVGLMVFAGVAPVGEWFRLQHTSRVTTMVTLLILGAAVLSQILTGLVIGVYRSVGEYGRGGIVGNCVLAAQVLLVAGALLLTQSFPVVAAATSIPLWLGMAFSVWDIGRRHPAITFGVRQGTWLLALQILGPSSLFLLIMLSQVLTTQGAVLILSIHCGGAAVAVFATTRILAGAARKLASVVQHGVWPEFTALQAEQELDKIRSLHIGLVKLSLILTLAATMSLYFVGAELYRFWTQRVLEFDPLLLALLLASVTTESLWRASSVVPLSSNRHAGVAVRFVGTGLLATGLCLALVPPYGAPGAVLGLWLADIAVRVVAIPNRVCRLLRQPLARFWAQAVLRGLPAIGLACVAAVVTHEATRGTALHLPLVPCVTVGVLGAASFLTWFDDSERRRVRNLVRALRPGR